MRPCRFPRNGLLIYRVSNTGEYSVFTLIETYWNLIFLGEVGLPQEDHFRPFRLQYVKRCFTIVM